MMIAILCPCGCGKTLHLREEMRGKVVACPASGQRVVADVRTQLCAEDTWQQGLDPASMLRYVSHHASERKLRLAAVGCCRLLGEVVSNPFVQHALRTVEDFADDRATAEEMGQSVKEGVRWLGLRAADLEFLQAHTVVRQLSLADARVGASVAGYWAMLMGQPTGEARRRAVAGVLHEVFGNPFEPLLVDTTWLRWNDHTVQRIARMFYEERQLSDLPILADALEDGGCDAPELLTHLRGPGPHLRGCWALDRVLGRRR